MKVDVKTYIQEEARRLRDRLDDNRISYQYVRHESGEGYNILFDLPANTDFELTNHGKASMRRYLAELQSKRAEVLKAGEDTADETDEITEDDIVNDISFIGVDKFGEYFNGWPVTDHIDMDYPILLKIGRDFLPVR